MVDAKVKVVSMHIGGRGEKGKHRASEGVCPRAAHKKESLFQRWGRDKEMGRCGFINAGKTLNVTLLWSLANLSLIADRPKVLSITC